MANFVTPEQKAQKSFPCLDFVLYGNDVIRKYFIDLFEDDEQINITREQFERLSSYIKGIPYRNEDHPSKYVGKGYYPVSYDEIKYIQGVSLPPVDVVASKPTTKKINNAKILFPVLALVAVLILFNK